MNLSKKITNTIELNILSAYTARARANFKKLLTKDLGTSERLGLAGVLAFKRKTIAKRIAQGEKTSAVYFKPSSLQWKLGNTGGYWHNFGSSRNQLTAKHYDEKAVNMALSDSALARAQTEKAEAVASAAVSRYLEAELKKLG